MKNRRIRCLCAIALTFLIHAVCSFEVPAQNKAEELLIVATDYPPYEFEQPDGDLRGFDLEVVEEAFKRAGMSVVFEFYPWARAVQMTKEGKATAALSCAYDSEREDFMLFSEPISFMTDIMLVRKDYDGEPVKTLEDMNRLKLDVGVIRGEILSSYLDEMGIPYDESPNFEVAVKKIADGRLDVAPFVLEFAGYHLRKLGMENDFKWFLRSDVRTDAFHLCFSKNRAQAEEVLKRFNAGLKAIQDDGTYDAIHARYR